MNKMRLSKSVAAVIVGAIAEVATAGVSLPLESAKMDEALRSAAAMALASQEAETTIRRHIKDLAGALSLDGAKIELKLAADYTYDDSTGSGLSCYQNCYSNCHSAYGSRGWR